VSAIVSEDEGDEENSVSPAKRPTARDRSICGEASTLAEVRVQVDSYSIPLALAFISNAFRARKARASRIIFTHFTRVSFRSRTFRRVRRAKPFVSRSPRVRHRREKRATTATAMTQARAKTFRTPCQTHHQPRFDITSLGSNPTKHNGTIDARRHFASPKSNRNLRLGEFTRRQVGDVEDSWNRGFSIRSGYC
jgi:hypothetical protein